MKIVVGRVCLALALATFAVVIWARAHRPQIDASWTATPGRFPDYELVCNHNKNLAGWVWRHEGEPEVWSGLVFDERDFTSKRAAKRWVESEFEKLCLVGTEPAR